MQSDITHSRSWARKLTVKLSKSPCPVRHSLGFHFPSMISFGFDLFPLAVITDYMWLRPQIVSNLRISSKYAVLGLPCSITFFMGILSSGYPWRANLWIIQIREHNDSARVIR